MESMQKKIDTSILLAPAIIAIYLLVVFESYVVENAAFNYIFQM